MKRSSWKVAVEATVDDQHAHDPSVIHESA
jgi:hypothetical protein